MWATLYSLDIINSEFSEDIWIPAVKITSTNLKLFTRRVQIPSGKVLHIRVQRRSFYLLTNLEQVEFVHAFFQYSFGNFSIFIWQFFNIHLAIFQYSSGNFASATIFDFLIDIQIIKRYIFNWLTLNFLCFYLNHHKWRRSLIFQTLNFVRSNCLSFKSLRFTLTGCKDSL